MKLQTKVLLLAGLIMFAFLGGSTLVHIWDVNRNYLEALEWRSEALGNAIMSHILTSQTKNQDDIENDQTLLEPLSSQCLYLYNLYQEEEITQIALINPEGTIIAHNDKALLSSSIESPLLREHFQQRTLTTFLDGSIYQTLIPIIADDHTYLGSLYIGFPKHVLANNVSASLFHFVKVMGVLVVLTVLIVPVLVRRLIMKSVKQLVLLGEQLAEGEPIQHAQMYAQGGELAGLETVFHRISAYLQDIAEIASHITAGILDSDMRVRSKHDVLGNAVQDMLHHLKQVTRMAIKITEGDLTESIPVRSAEDAFGRAIQTMAEGLRALIDQIRTRSEEIATTGENILALGVHDIGIVQNVNTSASQMISTVRDIGTSVEEVAQEMDTLSSAMTQTSGSIAEMTASITSIASNTSDLTEQTQRTIELQDEAINLVERVSKSTIGSLESSQETIRYALEGQQSVDHVMNSMEELQRTFAAAVSAITDFAKRSQEIDRILDVIREIAEQTQLLSLNASIIAAQAGIHGRGFAVVADEIKNLAAGVKNSTKDIATIVQMLQQDTNNVVQTIHKGTTHVEQSSQRTQHARETLQQIIASAQHSSTMVTEIADALHELKTTSYNVTTAMELVNVMTDDITSATHQQSASTIQINKTMESINDMASQIQQATTLQTDGIRDILTTTQNISTLMNQNLESSQNITDTTGELVSQANFLLHSVERFKVSP